MDHKEQQPGMYSKPSHFIRMTDRRRLRDMIAGVTLSRRTTQRWTMATQGAATSVPRAPLVFRESVQQLRENEDVGNER
ncbi:hypothetical protein E2C01_054833 [Portunus trituberculatus]|uniref:Uncharacterized protein n=1 Tax=Portunus trituberculatus TaxID=210409 RepID=A0A5B7GUC5_PORTR|nr:hypothetical protein [Portunus trituberculatus]